MKPDDFDSVNNSNVSIIVNLVFEMSAYHLCLCIYRDSQNTPTRSSLKTWTTGRRMSRSGLKNEIFLNLIKKRVKPSQRLMRLPIRPRLRRRRSSPRLQPSPKKQKSRKRRSRKRKSNLSLSLNPNLNLRYLRFQM